MSSPGTKTRRIGVYNAADTAWRQQRITIGLLLRLSHDNTGTVSDAWERTSSAVSSYLDCERSFAFPHLMSGMPATKDDALNACLPQQKEFYDSQNGLFSALRNSEEQDPSHQGSPPGFWCSLFGRR